MADYEGLAIDWGDDVSTDNQDKAIDRLMMYRDAKKNIEAAKLKIEELETRCNRQTRDPASIMQRKRNTDGTFTMVPVVTQSNRHGNSAEDMVEQLIDMKSEYGMQCMENDKLCMDIEREISLYCHGVYARILSYYYLYNKNLEFIAVQENFSYPHIKRLRWRALETFGRNMSHNDP